jgi:hypothetical protein
MAQLPSWGVSDLSCLSQFFLDHFEDHDVAVLADIDLPHADLVKLAELSVERLVEFLLLITRHNEAVRVAMVGLCLRPIRESLRRGPTLSLESAALLLKLLHREPEGPLSEVIEAIGTKVSSNNCFVEPFRKFLDECGRLPDWLWAKAQTALFNKSNTAGNSLQRTIRRVILERISDEIVQPLIEEQLRVLPAGWKDSTAGIPAVQCIADIVTVKPHLASAVVLRLPFSENDTGRFYRELRMEALLIFAAAKT